MKSKSLIIALLVVVIAAVILLAAGLEQLHFRPGDLFSEVTLSELRSLLTQFGRYGGLIWICLAVVPLLFVLMSFSNRTKNTARLKSSNWILGTLIQLILWIVALTLLRRKLIESELEWTASQIDLQAVDLPEIEAVQIIPLHIPDLVAFLVSLGLIFLVGLGLWLTYQRRRRVNRPLEMLTNEAAAALDGIDAGFDLRDVILRCYYDMVSVVEQTRSIKRGQGMTAREFETNLVALGLPGEPVIQLTRLFEAVRYGSKDLGEEAEMRARDCLSAILKTSGKIL